MTTRNSLVETFMFRFIPLTSLPSTSLSHGLSLVLHIFRTFILGSPSPAMASHSLSRVAVPPMPQTRQHHESFGEAYLE